jgi:uncharacterized SAM-binding protein YcdF (DUF218 family)
MADGSTLIFLTKSATQALSPLGLGLGLLLVSAGLLSAGRLGLARWVFVSAVAGLWIASLPPVATWTLSTLEQQYPPKVMAETPEADVAILLGGAVHGPDTASD